MSCLPALRGFRFAVPAGLSLLVLTLACGGGSGGPDARSLAKPPFPTRITSTPPPSAEAGHLYTYTIITADAQGGLAWSTASPLPEGAVLDGATLTWTPSAAQAGVPQSFVLMATDEADRPFLQRWVVTPAALAFTSTAPPMARVAHAYAYTIATLNPSGDPVQFELTAGPAGAMLTDNLLTWTPIPQQVGQVQTFTLKASDGLGALCTQTWQVTPEANGAPLFTTTPPNTASTAAPYVYTMGAGDPDGDTVAYTLLDGPSSATLSGKVLTWAVQPAQARIPATFSVQAADGLGGATLQTWTLTPSGPVHLAKVTTYLTGGGALEVPEDLGPRVGTGFYQALVPDGSGGFTTLDTFTAQAPGSGTLTGVPPGHYWLKAGPSTYLWTDRSVVDLGRATYTRQSPEYAGPGTSLGLNLTGMSPWGPYGNLYLYAPGFDYLNYFSDTGQPYPFTTATSMVANINWQGSPLLQPAKGDGLYLAAVRQEPAIDEVLGTDASSLGKVQVLKDALGPVALEQSNGINLSFSGELQPAPAGGALRVNWNRQAFLDCQGEMGATSCTFQMMDLVAHPGGIAWGLTATSLPDLGTFYPKTYDGAPVKLKPVPFGNPFPASWSLLNVTTMTFKRTYQVPGAPRVAGSGGIQNLDTVLPTAEAPVVPLVTPPRALTLQKDVQDPARSAAGDLSGFGLTPILAWVEPREGTANNYEVTIYGLSKTSGANPAVVAVLRTETTRIQLPPNLLAQGEYYYFKVRALHKAGVGFATGPFRSALPSGIADALTGLLTP
jgi:hypothetical protein